VKAHVLLSFLLLSSACALSQPVAAPGIQPAEQRVLQMGASSGSPSQDRLVERALRGDESAAHRFFTLAPEVDGEVALGYQTRIWMFLFEAGDIQFANVLERESPVIRAAVARFIDQLLQSHPTLSYPRTHRALVQPPVV
jgi:hypothetical protein